MTTHDDTANIMRELERELGVRGPANVLRAALNIAKEAAAQAKAANPQPVDPAWMVEVMREALGRVMDEDGLPVRAKNAREGGEDDKWSIRSSTIAFRLALSRGHVVLAPVMPSEEEMLRDAREDVAHVLEARGYPDEARECRAGKRDHFSDMLCALQARRNVYASLGAVKAVSSGPVVPEVDLREALKRAWTDGFGSAASALDALAAGESDAAGLYASECDGDVSAILENLKSGEA